MILTSWNVPITVGTPAVTDVIPAAGFEIDAVLTLAAAAERGSEHPFASAIVHGAADRGLTAIEPTSVAMIPHHGIRARLGERRVLVGSRALLEAAGVKAAALANDAVRLVDEGKSPVFVALDDRAAGIIAIGAPVHASSSDPAGAMRTESAESLMWRDPSAGSAARCLVCGHAIPAGAGSSARFGERTLRFQVRRPSAPLPGASRSLSRRPWDSCCEEGAEESPPSELRRD